LPPVELNVIAVEFELTWAAVEVEVFQIVFKTPATGAAMVHEVGGPDELPSDVYPKFEIGVAVVADVAAVRVAKEPTLPIVDCRRRELPVE